MKPNDQVYTQLIHTDAYHTLCDKQANTASHKSATRNQSFLLKAASCASVWFRPCAQNRAHLIMLETYRSTCVCCVNEEKSFGSSGIFHEFFIQMNSVSLSSMQASSCLMCAGFLKRPAMKSALVPWICIPQVISFLWGTSLGTPCTVTHKRMKRLDYLLANTWK